MFLKQIFAREAKLQGQICYNPRQKSWHACSLFQYLSRQFISSPPPPNSMLFIVMKLSLLVSSIVGGGRGFLIPMMPLFVVSKVACQRMFQLSDPGVPRTFVEDCSFKNIKFPRDNSSKFSLDFLTSPSSYLFSTRRTKDFSYLIGANFSDPKTGRYALTNQRSPGYPWGPTCETMFNERDLRLSSKLQNNSYGTF